MIDKKSRPNVQNISFNISRNSESQRMDRNDKNFNHVIVLTGTYESDNESSDEGVSYEELYDSFKELLLRSEEVIAQLLTEKNKQLSANSDLQNEVILQSSELEKQKKTINDFFMEKEKLMSIITSLQEENTLLNSKLENMTKYVRMLNNGSNVLDEILQVGRHMEI